MSIAEELHEGADLKAEMLALGWAARQAAAVLARATTRQKNEALIAAAAAIRANGRTILEANEQDMTRAGAGGLTSALLDRLLLNEERLEAMATGLADIAALPDPVGRTLAEWQRPNGLEIRRVSVPLGVVAIIYESRPNVTADAGGLCLKSGNVAVLRGGSESFHSSRAIHASLVQGLEAADLPSGAIQLVPTRDRAAVGQLLTMPEYIDIVVPRGGKSLIERVQKESRVPVIAHLDGNCHVYVDRAASLEMARSVVVNAKMRRTGICGAAETLLVDRGVAETHLKPLVEDLIQAGCEVRGDEATQAVDGRVRPATSEDWDREYLDAIIAVKLVDGVTGAMDHVQRHGSHHTESIITEDQETAEKFLAEVDSAILLHNASTQFADGGEFGMGAEIGISTGRLHARGPVGLEQLTSFKYVVHGSGQIRP